VKRLAWSEVRSARQPGLKQELRVLIELLRVLPKPGVPMHLTILPSNIMVGDDGSVLVGAAPLDGASHQERYLAPEVQCGAEPVLPSAIYSVGALLFEAVTGHRFETRDLVTQELAGARAMARAAGLGARFWEIYLLEAAAKATEEQPEARWHSGSDFAEDLERVARDRIVTRVDLGRLVSEVVEARGSSLPPKQSKQSSGPPDGASRSGPPPLPKRVRRRTSQSSKQKAVSGGPKPAASAGARQGAPIPRTDGDAPQMPLITALRVPSNLKLPEAASSLAASSLAAPSSQPVAASSPAPVVEVSSGASRVVAASAVPKRTRTPLGGISSAAPSASKDSPASSAAGSALKSSAPNGSASNGSHSNGSASSAAASGKAASGSPFAGRVNPVTLGPRLDSDLDEPTRPLRVDAGIEIEEPTVPRALSSAAPPPQLDEPTVPRAQSNAAPARRPEPSVEIEEPTVPRAHTSVAPVVVPSLAPPPADQGASGESRRRTLTGTGDLRWLEGLQPPADLLDPNRHGTLLGLGNPAPTARLEPAFAEPEPPTTPMRPGPPTSQRPNSAPSAVSVTGAGTPYARSSTPPGSSPPSQRASGPSSNPPASSNRMRYVHSPTLESGWDAAASEGEGGARDSTSDVAFLPKKSWLGRVLLAVVVLVALGIGTLEVVGHYAENDEKAAAPVAPKPAVASHPETKPDATPAPVARASDAPRVVPDESEAAEPEHASADEPAPTAAPEPEAAAAAEAPAPPKRAAPVRRAPARAPVRPAAPAKAPPAAPPRTAPAKEPDYGI